MKIVYLTAGAAGMYCGSCLHDNALAKELIRSGHDCLLVPVYTPIRTDDEDVSLDRVFMGGINVFLQQKMPWLAYTPRWLDKILNQPELIRLLTRNVGKTPPQFLGSLTVSMLKGTSGNQRKEFLRLLDWIQRDIQPDVLILTNLLIAGGIRDIKASGRSKVFVTLQGDDIFIQSLPEPYRQQTINLMRSLVSEVDGFILHSHYYADLMGELLAIPPAKRNVVPLGIPTIDFHSEIAGPQNKTYDLGYLARMAPEKGLHRLVDAFLALARRPGFEHVNLKIAGWKGPQHESYWQEQQHKLNQAGLANRWIYAGSIDRNQKAAFLKSLDLFCVPTTYEEPKGLFLLEAVASGVPYLQPAHGAFPEIHKRLATLTSATLGRLFEASCERSLVDSLSTMITSNYRRYIPTAEIQKEISIERHAERVLQLISS